jgi:hypothetical protein
VPQGIVRLDFVLGDATRKIGLNISSHIPPAPPLSELFRDIAATVYGCTSAVYTFNAKAALYTLDDALYLLSIAEPWVFALRSLLVLKTASRIAHDGGEVTRNSIGIEGHFQRDEWDPSHVSDRVFVRRIAAGESSWQQHRDFLERRLNRSIDAIAAEWTSRSQR